MSHLQLMKHTCMIHHSRTFPLFTPLALWCTNTEWTISSQTLHFVCFVTNPLHYKWPIDGNIPLLHYIFHFLFWWMDDTQRHYILRNSHGTLYLPRATNLCEFTLSHSTIMGTRVHNAPTSWSEESLLQNTSVVSVGKVFWYRPARQIPFIRYEKGGLFSIDCCQPIPKIIIGIGCLKTTDTNKCPAWPISKALLVSTGLNQPTPLSHVQIENIIWIRYETCIFFKFRIHSNIYTRIFTQQH
jgi:hypothetical protein